MNHIVGRGLYVRDGLSKMLRDEEMVERYRCIEHRTEPNNSRQQSRHSDRVSNGKDISLRCRYLIFVNSVFPEFADSPLSDRMPNWEITPDLQPCLTLKIVGEEVALQERYVVDQEQRR